MKKNGYNESEKIYKKICEQFAKGAIESLNNVELLELKGKKINYCLGSVIQENIV